MFNRRDFIKGAGAFSLLPSAAQAQADYPNQVVRTICMFPPGSGADVIVRFYANKLSKLTDKSFIVENRAGAFGNIATEYVARAKPDGYTVYIAPGSSVLAAAPHLFKKLPFDPLNDFEHITTMFKLPFLLVVAGNSPYKTVADLTERLKTLGDKGSYGSAANTGLVSSELYKAAFGLKTVEVKYKDPLAMGNDLLNGQLDFVHIDPITFAAQLKDGRMRAIALSSADVSKALPDIPTTRQAGIANADLLAWWSLHAPKGTPKPILDKLETWMNSVVSDPETEKFLTAIGSDTFPGNQRSVRTLLEQEIKAWERYANLAKIEKL